MLVHPIRDCSWCDDVGACGVDSSAQCSAGAAFGTNQVIALTAVAVGVNLRLFAIVSLNV